MTLLVLYIPIENPTMNRNSANSQYTFATPDKRLKTAFSRPNRKTMIFLPNLSASDPTTRAPTIQPTKMRDEETVP